MEQDVRGDHRQNFQRGQMAELLRVWAWLSVWKGALASPSSLLAVETLLLPPLLPPLLPRRALPHFARLPPLPLFSTPSESTGRDATFLLTLILSAGFFF